MSGKWYEGIPGIDAELGIANSASVETFRMLLTIFRDTIDESHDELCGYFESGDWKNYTVKVHSLKSTAKLIGARSLADEAFELEMAGKREDTDYIRSNHDALMKHLKGFAEPLNRAMSGGDAAEAAPHDEDALDLYLLESIYESLGDGARKHDDDMIADTFEEASEYTFLPADAERLEKLRTCFENRDYDGMINIIDGM